MNYFDMLPEEIVDKIFFEAHKTNMHNVLIKVIQRGLDLQLELLEQLRPIKWTLDDGIYVDHIFQIYDGYDVGHLSHNGFIAMTKDVLDVFKADLKKMSNVSMLSPGVGI